MSEIVHVVDFQADRIRSGNPIIFVSVVSFNNLFKFLHDFVFDHARINVSLITFFIFKVSFYKNVNFFLIHRSFKFDAIRFSRRQIVRRDNVVFQIFVFSRLVLSNFSLECWPNSQKSLSAPIGKFNFSIFPLQNKMFVGVAEKHSLAVGQIESRRFRSHGFFKTVTRPKLQPLFIRFQIYKLHGVTAED